MKQFNQFSSGKNRFPLALVTGAAHRLGRSFALSLARLGYGVILHYHNSDRLIFETVNQVLEMGVPAFPIRADLRNSGEIVNLFNNMDELIEDTALNLGSLQVLVNSAAIMLKSDLQATPIEEFDNVMALNIRAPFFCSQQAFQRMSDCGVIINISDIAAEKSWKDYGAYSISKAGLDSLTRLLAKSFAPKVRVNGIAPGLVMASDEITPENWGRLVNRLPINREANIEEVCDVLEFLIKNEYITGQIIKVDGGYSLL